MDCSTPGFPVHHQLLELTQTLKRFSNVLHTHPFFGPLPTPALSCLHGACSFSHFLMLLCSVVSTLWGSTEVRQAPPSMGFSRQEYWSGLPFPSPGDLPDTGIDSASPTWAGWFFTIELPGKPLPLPPKNDNQLLLGHCLKLSSIFPVRKPCFPSVSISLYSLPSWSSHTGERGGNQASLLPPRASVPAVLSADAYRPWYFHHCPR